MSMTPEQEADEFVLFQGFTRKKWNAAHGPLSMDWSSWLARAEIAHAERAELVAERDRLRERVRELASEALMLWFDEESEHSAEFLWEFANESEPEIMQLAEEAGCWFDDEWRARQGGAG